MVWAPGITGDIRHGSGTAVDTVGVVAVGTDAVLMHIGVTRTDAVATLMVTTVVAMLASMAGSLADRPSAVESLMAAVSTVEAGSTVVGAGK